MLDFQKMVFFMRQDIKIPDEQFLSIANAARIKVSKHGQSWRADKPTGRDQEFREFVSEVLRPRRALEL